MIVYDERGTMSKTAREFILAKTDGHCLYCGLDLSGVRWEADHLYPKSRGGCLDCIENLYPSCPKCNRSKSNRTLAEWRKMIFNKFSGGEWEVKFWFEDQDNHITWEVAVT